MAFQNKVRKKWFVWTCGTLAASFVVLALFGLAYSWRQFTAFRASMQYPGSVALSHHENYSNILSGFRWDATFLSQDDFRDVFGWYSVKYVMGAEDAAMGRCSYVERTDKTHLTQTTISLHLCDTDEGRHINVSRQTKYGNIFSISAWRDFLRDQF